jgi:hypothetical protein
LACFSDGVAFLFDRSKKDTSLLHAEKLLMENHPSSPKSKQTQQRQQQQYVHEHQQLSKSGSTVTNFTKSEGLNPQQRWILTNSEVSINGI